MTARKLRGRSPFLYRGWFRSPRWGGFPKKKADWLPGGPRGIPLAPLCLRSRRRERRWPRMGYPNRINSAWYARTYRNKNLVCGPPSFGRALARGPQRRQTCSFHLPVFFLRIPAAALSPEPTHTIRAAPWVRSPAEGVYPSSCPQTKKSEACHDPAPADIAI